MDNILIGIKAFKALRKLCNFMMCVSLVVLGTAFMQDWSMISYLDDYTRRVLLGALLIKWGVSK